MGTAISALRSRFGPASTAILTPVGPRCRASNVAQQCVTPMWHTGPVARAVRCGKLRVFQRDQRASISAARANWCPEEDSNLHALRRCYLKAVRLPIPPSGHGVEWPLPARAASTSRRRAECQSAPSRLFSNSHSLPEPRRRRQPRACAATRRRTPPYGTSGALHTGPANRIVLRRTDVLLRWRRAPRGTLPPRPRTSSGTPLVRCNSKGE